jgi:subtilisin family serine protease
MPDEPTHEPQAADYAGIYRQIVIIKRADYRFADVSAQIERRLAGFKYRRLPDNEDLGLIAIEAEPGDVPHILEVLRETDGVDTADQNRPLQPSWVVDDPLYPDQWALWRMGAEPAWRHALRTLNLAAPGVIVAIVDSGIHVGHPDLAGHLWTDGGGNHGYNVLTGTADVFDSDGHGTLLAGTVGAISNNATGIAAAQWPIRLMAVKFFDPSTPPNALAAVWAIWWAVVNGADVIVAAWALGVRFGALRAAIDFARVQGRVFVAAAGNDGLDNDGLPTYPANYGVPPLPTPPLSNVIAVMASERPDHAMLAAGDSRDDKAWFSNYGTKRVHLAAPGVGTLSTHTYFATPQWRVYGGTSAACAHVAYAAALLKALNPAWTPTDIRRHLVASVDKSPWLKCIARGRLSLDRAVVGPFVITSPTSGDVWAVGTNVQVRWRRRYQTPLATSVRILLSRNGAPYTPIATGQPNNGVCTVTASSVPVANARLRVQSEQGPGLYADSAVFTIA